MITEGELIFIDTNILLSATDTSRESHIAAKTIFNKILKAGCNPVACGQVIREYLVVATRPLKSNGLGLSTGDAIHNIRQFMSRITLFEEKLSAVEILQHLIIKHQIAGKRIHDANIAAVMKIHGISYLVTDNKSDFSCFDKIKPLSCSEAVETFTALL